MNCTQAKQIRIEDFLKSTNRQPDISRRNGTALMYKAPYREEKKASFEVNTLKNIWYDHGTGIGGNIIDLVMKIHQTDLEGSLAYLRAKTIEPFSFYQQKTPDSISRHKTEILEVKLITHPALIEYLRKRMINLSLAKIYLKEIIYKNWNSKINDYKTYRALGFRNDHGGYELRNKYFQGCTSKFFTTIPGLKRDQLNIFEGFFDFLSAMEWSNTQNLKFDSLILNSVALKEKTLKLIRKYEKLNLFLDNDEAGQKTVQFFKSELQNKSVNNFSKIMYPNYKDFNEYLISIMQ